MADDLNKTVVAVAGRPHKVRPIEIALRTRMVNALVTVEKTASELLARAPKKGTDGHMKT